MRLIPTALLAAAVALATPAAGGPLAYAACQTGASFFLRQAELYPRTIAFSLLLPTMPLTQ